MTYKQVTWVGVLIMLICGGCTMWRVFMRSEDTRGPQAPIPEPAIAAPPADNTTKHNWPNWRGPNLDGHSGITGIRTDWSGGLKLIWKVDYLCQGSHAATWSAPVIRDNRLIVPGRTEQEDIIFCLDADSGLLIWKQSYAAEEINGYGPGARATPFIDGDSVYTFGKAGHLACWSLADGTMQWIVDVDDHKTEMPYFGYSSSPLVIGDSVIVSGGDTATVIAFNKATGALQWKALQGVGGYAAITRMSVAGTAQIIAFHGNGVAGIEPADGTVLWDSPWRTRGTVNATTPVSADGILFITSGYRTGCQALKPDQNSVGIVWTNKSRKPEETIAAMHSDPIIIDGYVYGYSGQSSSNKSGRLNCLDLTTGTVQWSSREAGQGTMLYIDGHLLCLDLRGNLYLIKPSPHSFEKTTAFPRALGNTSKPIWTAPAAADGKLYLRHRQHLYCYDLINPLEQ